MLIISSNIDIFKATKMLTCKFHMKYLGFANMIMGMKIFRTFKRFVLSQLHERCNDSLARTSKNLNLHLMGRAYIIARLVNLNKHVMLKTCDETCASYLYIGGVYTGN